MASPPAIRPKTPAIHLHPAHAEKSRATYARPPAPPKIHSQKRPRPCESLPKPPLLNPSLTASHLNPTDRARAERGPSPTEPTLAVNHVPLSPSLPSETSSPNLPATRGFLASLPTKPAKVPEPLSYSPADAHKSPEGSQPLHLHAHPRSSKLPQNPIPPLVAAPPPTQTLNRPATPAARPHIAPKLFLARQYAQDILPKPVAPPPLLDRPPFLTTSPKTPCLAHRATPPKNASSKPHYEHSSTTAHDTSPLSPLDRRREECSYKKERTTLSEKSAFSTTAIPSESSIKNHTITLTRHFKRTFMSPKRAN